MNGLGGVSKAWRGKHDTLCRISVHKSRRRCESFGASFSRRSATRHHQSNPHAHKPGTVLGHHPHPEPAPLHYCSCHGARLQCAPLNACRATLSHKLQAAVTALNTLQSNFSIVDAIRKSGRGMNKNAIPEMVEWLRKAGYEVCGSPSACIRRSSKLTDPPLSALRIRPIEAHSHRRHQG